MKADYKYENGYFMSKELIDKEVASYLLANPLKAMPWRSVFSFGIFACLAYLLLSPLGSYGFVFFRHSQHLCNMYRILEIDRCKLFK